MEVQSYMSASELEQRLQSRREAHPYVPGTDLRTRAGAVYWHLRACLATRLGATAYRAATCDALTRIGGLTLASARVYTSRFGGVLKDAVESVRTASGRVHPVDAFTAALDADSAEWQSILTRHRYVLDLWGLPLDQFFADIAEANPGTVHATRQVRQSRTQDPLPEDVRQAMVKLLAVVADRNGTRLKRAHHESLRRITFREIKWATRLVYGIPEGFVEIDLPWIRTQKALLDRDGKWIDLREELRLLVDFRPVPATVNTPVFSRQNGRVIAAEEFKRLWTAACQFLNGDRGALGPDVGDQSDLLALLGLAENATVSRARVLDDVSVNFTQDNGHTVGQELTGPQVLIQCLDPLLYAQFTTLVRGLLENSDGSAEGRARQYDYVEHVFRLFRVWYTDNICGSPDEPVRVPSPPVPAAHCHRFGLQGYLPILRAWDTHVTTHMGPVERAAEEQQEHLSRQRIVLARTATQACCDRGLDPYAAAVLTQDNTAWMRDKDPEKLAVVPADARTPELTAAQVEALGGWYHTVRPLKNTDK